MAWLLLAQVQCVRSGRSPDSAQTYVRVSPISTANPASESRDWGPFSMNDGDWVDLADLATPSEFAGTIAVTMWEQAEDGSYVDIGTNNIREESDKDAGLREVVFRPRSLPITSRAEYVLTYWVASALGTESPRMPPKS
jgi:hypothetical protein